MTSKRVANEIAFPHHEVAIRRRGTLRGITGRGTGVGWVWS